MKIRFYRKLELEEERELILEKELPLDEVSIYSALLKKEYEKELEKDRKEEDKKINLVIMSEDKLVEGEVIREVLIRPLVPHKLKQ